MTPGQVLAGRYELREAIARGGMGEVWAGHDRVLSREVALKVLDVGAAGDALAAERFRREATAAAALSHPHVVAVYDAGVEDGVAFLVMEMLSGPTVAGLIEQRGQLPVELALRLARQAAEGLEAVHQVGLVHRDVKPGNLMLDQGGRLKVVDFGIARLAEATAGRLTATGNIIGSAAFLSPEQARGEAATAAGDLYSLGCVLMAMLTGQPPFLAEHPMGLLRLHLEEPPPRVRDRRPGVPAWVDDVVDGLLAKEPGRRASALARLLVPTTPLDPTAVLPAASSHAASPSPQPPPPPPPPPSPERSGLPRRALVPIGAGLAVLLLLAGLWWIAGDRLADRSPGGVGGPAGETSAPAVSSAPTTPGAGEPGSLTAAVDGLQDAVRQARTEGELDEKAAADLVNQARDLGKKAEEQKLDELVKKVDELARKLDELERAGALDAAAAARIREAIDAVRAAA